MSYDMLGSTVRLTYFFEIFGALLSDSLLFSIPGLQLYLQRGKIQTMLSCLCALNSDIFQSVYLKVDFEEIQGSLLCSRCLCVCVCVCVWNELRIGQWAETGRFLRSMIEKD